MPSSRSSHLTPRAVKDDAMADILSDSFTLNSPAPLIIVLPAAKAAATHITGNSSMAGRSSSPLTSVPVRLEVFTRMSATGSPEMFLTLRVSTTPPIFSSIFKTPVRVGFTPTSLIISSESSVIMAPTMRKAAEDRSPGTVISVPINSPVFFIDTVLFSTAIPAPKSSSILSVWSRLFSGSVTLVSPSAYRPARRSDDFNCALATGVEYFIPVRAAGAIARGSLVESRLPAIDAPMLFRG